MKPDTFPSQLPIHMSNCPCGHAARATHVGTTRSSLLATTSGLGLLGTALTGITWSPASAAELEPPPKRRALVVKPIFTYPKPERTPQASWRNWGGIQSAEDVRAEEARIHTELEQLKAQAACPLEFLPLATVRRPEELSAHQSDLQAADVLLFYSAGDGGGDLMTNVNHLDALGKDVIFFVRHKSGPLYYWYEGAMARLLHQHTDSLASKTIKYEDVVVDSLDEIRWRLQSLCGLYNTRGSTIVAIGGPGGWAQPAGVVPDLARQRFQLDIQTVSYEEVGKLIQAARDDQTAVDQARARADAYLKMPGTTLETHRSFVDNAFLLEQVFRRLMAQANCRALTINECMGTIMPLAQTTACLTLSLLNDAGYLAFCESDFVVIPAGILLANISDRPVFLNDPTYPHDGIITLAHCTAPRRMGGGQLDAARIMTHFESDYGAAPKVEMPAGQLITNVVPDFQAERWTGLLARVESSPFLPICRSQIDVRIACPDRVLAEHMPGFHWITGYGDHLREVGYAARKIGIAWNNISRGTV
jgi:NAD(P)H-hydrate repair Nnr-like enzyme with NAD(P)H-hydrate epimerase domain